MSGSVTKKGVLNLSSACDWWETKTVIPLGGSHEWTNAASQTGKSMRNAFFG